MTAGDDRPGPPGASPTFIERARQRQIVEAAVATIAEDGYANATFARIAKRAGVSPALISYHFANKATLMARVVAEVTAALDAAIVEATADAASYGAALRGLIETQVRWFAGHGTEVRALGQIFDHSGLDGGDDLGGAQRRQGIDEIEAMLREGQDEGELGPFDARVVAVTLMASLEAVPGELFARPDTDVDTYARELADIFVAATRRGRRRRAP